MIPGLALAFGVGLAALGIRHALPPSPYVSDVLVAIALGALILNTPLGRMLRLPRPSEHAETHAYAKGLGFTGKWVLRAAIVLMGLKVQTKFLGAGEVALILGVAAASIPSAFFVAHAMGAWLGLRRPLVDLVAGGTMICGASAVQAIAPVAGGERDDQGIAIATVFVFSVTALLAFRPIALYLDVDPSYAGLWAGLSVNDLSSAIAVGQQMGGAGDAGGVMAAASKSARVLLLAPTLVAFALLRGHAAGGARVDLRKRVAAHLPGFLLGYLALAAARALGDRVLVGNTAWAAVLDVNRVLVDVAMVSVSASIGLHLELRGLLRAGVRALAVGGVTSVWMAGVTLAMICAGAHGSTYAVVLIGASALALSYLSWRIEKGRALRKNGLRVGGNAEMVGAGQHRELRVR
ncbi:putative sulfate exporter family transporter [Pendulispora rubella]|uniref:Sulfate exporter family transporter n=1 Tax=Pendulispora rubella TaxID=2741070 RepID=A0ABZ2KVE3_9BACT